MSYGWRALPSASEPPSPGVSVMVVDGHDRLARETVIALDERPAPAIAVNGKLPVVLLLHGSPGSRHEVGDLAGLLNQRYRTLAPDLPGFGASRAHLPDYSIAAHADYMIQLLDALAIDRVHVIGFSMGGGVGIELAQRERQRVQSLTLLASIGAQEYELFGDYRLNHAVHGAQLAGLWGLHRLVPHFGWLDGFALDIPYARNFYDTDQRPLREALGGLEMPVLILHGESDLLVPVAAAREHHRIAPHSELIVYPSNHFMAFLQPETLAADLHDFLRRVDDGKARRRGAATQDRLAAAARALDPATLPRAMGPTLAVWLLLIAAATLVSEDLTCIATGLLVAQGRLGFGAGVTACFVGIFVGDLALYLAGRWLGRPWLNRAPLKWFITEQRLAESSRWFERRGAAVIFLSRFWPGMRLPTYVVAGLLRTSFSRFALLFALAVAVWTPVLVGGAAWLGRPWLELAGSARHSVWWVVLMAAILAWMLATLRQLASYRGRRLWRGRWCRRLRWEFWPRWLFYSPVLPWIAWLSLRHRGVGVFTAANPGMPEGGFVGESKADILDALPAETVAKFLRLPASEGCEGREEAVRKFVATRGLELPLVIKPDVGQRGEGVTIARTWAQVRQALGSPRDLIAQEFVPGVEVGIFYVRRPGDESGEIFSITEKELPAVRGDGESTLEQLVLSDERAVCLADLYLAGLDRPPDAVPAAGERVPLTELGTHCRGAIFRDGSALKTPALEAEIERLSRACRGFYFGRYDLKAPSLDDLVAGRHLRVLELNGVTSEATHIYDPSSGLLAAYRVLFRQWRLAFEIGAANRNRGAAVTPLRRLVQLALGHVLARSS
ncbi:MAG: alpha/beta fold hydrolase [Acidobacteria bacterium]|nr:alpha/beta fold hydrolase [Acidobacteriota bacterium]